MGSKVHVSCLQYVFCIEDNVHMTISDEDIAEFQRLYKNRYGTEISKQNAYMQGMNLACLLKRIYTPITEKEYEDILQRKAETLPEMLEHFSLQERDSIV